MTGDSFGDLTFENMVTGNSFIAPHVDSQVWTPNPFNIHPSTAGWFDLVLRCDPVGREKCYTLRIRPGTSSYTMYAGSTTIRSGYLPTVKIGDVFSFMASRTTLSAFHNGNRFASLTDRTYKSGQTGLRLNTINVIIYGGQAPLITNFSTGSSGSPPTISSVDPTYLRAGSQQQNFTISGSNLGTCGGLVAQFSPSTGISSPPPMQLSTNQVKLLPSVDVNASLGTYSVSLASPAGRSNEIPFTVVGPNRMVVTCPGNECDITGLCSGCSQTIQREVQYQVMQNDGQPAAFLAVGEEFIRTGWGDSCGQSEPEINSNVCNEVPGMGITDSNGIFVDTWSLGSDAYVGCGWSNVTDHWQMCGYDLEGNIAARTFGTLTGFFHWDEIQINGVTTSLANTTGMPKGTEIYP